MHAFTLWDSGCMLSENRVGIFRRHCSKRCEVATCTHKRKADGDTGVSAELARPRHPRRRRAAQPAEKERSRVYTHRTARCRRHHRHFSGYCHSSICLLSRAGAVCPVESDVRNTVTTQEATYADSQAYDPTVKVESDGVTIAVTDNTTSVDVAGTHATCTKGTFSFSGSSGTYDWTP